MKKYPAFRYRPQHRCQSVLGFHECLNEVRVSLDAGRLMVVSAMSTKAHIASRRYRTGTLATALSSKCNAVYSNRMVFLRLSRGRQRFIQRQLEHSMGSDHSIKAATIS